MVFSAAFESGVGIARIVKLATDYAPNLAAGLDTLDWLANDLLTDSPKKNKGVVAISGEPVVDASALESIEL